MKVVFLGGDAAPFREGFDALAGEGAELVLVPDDTPLGVGASIVETADVLITTRFQADTPVPRALKLLQLPAAGYDNVLLDHVPDSAYVCNAYGHEVAIAEYAIGAMLNHRIPFADADRRLRGGDWRYSSGSVHRHRELSGSTLGIIGFGHIGKAVASRAKALGVRIIVSNRSPVMCPDVSESFALRDPDFYRQCDVLLVTLPASAETMGLVDAAAFSALREHALVINVGRGPVVAEAALYDALSKKRIGGAVIDTWYQYPASPRDVRMPATLPFHELSNIVMTPHMSAWTDGLIDRRRAAVAENVRLVGAGAEPRNVVRAPKRG